MAGDHQVHRQWGERAERLVRDRRNRAAVTRALSQATGRSLTVELETSATGAPAPSASRPAASAPTPGRPAPPEPRAEEPRDSEPELASPARRAPEPERRPDRPSDRDRGDAKPTKDAFTEKVSDLFGGVIQESP